MRLKDKVAVITGAAQGIGEATAELFAEEGAAILVIDKLSSGSIVAERIRARGGRALFVRADISDEAAVRGAIELAERSWDRLDILINNAAEFIFRGIDASAEDWRRILDVNVIGTSLCTRHAVQAMKKTGGGSIVNLGSISGFVAQPGYLTYSATKAAIIGMTRCMALDLARFNIRVNCVCPGVIRTAAADRYMARAKISEAEYLARYAPLHMLNRVGNPREVAFAILFLASDESSFVTASSLLVDGGYTAR